MMFMHQSVSTMERMRNRARDAKCQDRANGEGEPRATTLQKGHSHLKACCYITAILTTMDEEDEDDMYAPEEGPVPSQDVKRGKGNATNLQPTGEGTANDEEDEEEGEEVEEDESDSVGGDPIACYCKPSDLVRGRIST